MSNLAEKYFIGIIVKDLPKQLNQELVIYPNPVNGDQIQVKLDKQCQYQQYAISLNDLHRGTFIQRDYFQKDYLISIDIG